MDATELRSETTARVAAQIVTTRRRAAARRALYAEKRARRRAGVDARNARKLRRLETP